MKIGPLSAVLLLVGLAAFQAQAGTVTVSAKISATGTPAAEDNPPCDAVEESKTLAERLRGQGSEIVGKATAALGLGSDPFNERRIHNSVCIDLCATLPIGAQFTAEGSITPIDWRGKLPSDLPGTVNPGNWAAIVGPAISPTDSAQVVCYTAKNWSHNQARFVGVKLTW